MTEKTFVIGLTMAGAVSAGAYTAGVLDQLIRALDAHERARAAGRARHRVVLKVVSGASAGGVSGALAVASLIRGLDHRRERYSPVAWDPLDAPDPGAPEAPRVVDYDTILGPLHDIWVDRLRLYDAKGGGLLGDADLRAHSGALMSALDSEALDVAADEALAGCVWTGRPYAFIAEPFELFFTTTNLNGAPYQVPFGGGERAGHRMANHANVRHFRVRGLGSVEIGSRWLDIWRDDGIALSLPFDLAETIDFSRREKLGDRATAWTEFRETAMATGAFPGGLAARIVRADMDEFCPREAGGRARGGAWPLRIDPDQRPRPDWTGAPEGADATYVAVDGGVCNNEPFELARFTLLPPVDPVNPADWRLGINPREADKADRAVLMIDPFPEGPSFRLTDPDDMMARAIASVAGPLLGALIAQARLKPEELVAAADSEVHSRFLIAPRRRDADETPIDGAAAIACGALGGFSGFFDEAFRRHDFLLGQHNCQRFLRAHFTLAARNEVFGDAAPGDLAMRPILTPDPDEPPVAQPAWAQMPLGRLDETFRRIGRRLDKVFEAGLRSNVGVGAARWLIRRLWANGLRDAAHSTICRQIEAALLDRDQIFATFPADIRTPVGRKVLAHLAGPGPHLRSVEGTARALAGEDGPDAALREAVARAFRALRYGEVPKRYRLERYGSRKADGAKHDLHHLAPYGPGWLRRLTPGMEVTDDLG
ncbi:MAG: patatin-like phospholipase family protein [Rubrimonas sp.]|uniref:patatin-like phospholipase family protein n=1 Tax=Rubrimonas sp. TaxID=2036015 RepID=UPI002FDEF639